MKKLVEIAGNAAEQARKGVQAIANDAADRVVAAVGEASAAASNLVETGARMAEGVRVAAGTGTIRAAHGIAAVTDDALWSVRRPVETGLRTVLNLGADVLKDAGWTFIAGALWPPMVPIAVGVMLLAAPSTLTQAKVTADAEVAAIREAALRRRQEALNASLAAWKGLPPQVTMATEHVRLVIETGTGKADGVVLTGVFAGQCLTAINDRDIATLAVHAPDAETRQALEAWLQHRAAQQV